MGNELNKLFTTKKLHVLVFIVLGTMLTACRGSSSSIGVVFNYRWIDQNLTTNTHKLTRHSGWINKITIHHTATRNEYGTTDLQRLRSARRYHIERRGWGDIAYHYLIAADGTIYQGRDESYRGGSSTNYGLDNNLLIAVMGNFEVENPTQQALNSLTQLISNRMLHYDISPNNIKTHRDHIATLCPGARLHDWFSHVGQYEILNTYRTKR
ncbi:hypothetical protein EOL70_01945 [Leucothrix sargassi]|nr:hypothetical protein EOL70_01945 [Leucothrix sargassi]